MKARLEFPDVLETPIATTATGKEPPEPEPQVHDPVPLDPEFLAWLEELL